MFTTIIVGLIAGALGKLIMPGKDPGGIFITILLGIAGSFVGNFLAGKLSFLPEGSGFSLPSIACSTLGAIVLLFIWRLIKSR